MSNRIQIRVPITIEGALVRYVDADEAEAAPDVVAAMAAELAAEGGMATAEWAVQAENHGFAFVGKVQIADVTEVIDG